MYKVHGFLDDKIVIKWQMAHIPRVGETMRFSDEKYGIVTEVIWCMDEEGYRNPNIQRVNIRIESEKEKEYKPK